MNETSRDIPRLVLFKVKVIIGMSWSADRTRARRGFESVKKNKKRRETERQAGEKYRQNERDGKTNSDEDRKIRIRKVLGRIIRLPSLDTTQTA
jgi:hypothetical protein